MIQQAIEAAVVFSFIDPQERTPNLGFIYRTAERYLLPKTEPSSPLLAVTLLCQHL